MYDHSNDFERAREALHFIDPCCHHDDWKMICAALNDSFPGEDGFALFDAWSRGQYGASKAPDYNESTSRSAWRSFSPGGGVRINTLFGIARKNGWRPEPNSHDGISKGKDERKVKPLGSPARVSGGGCPGPSQSHHEDIPITREAKNYPPETELRQLMSLCRYVADDPDAARWCSIRGLDASAIDERGDAYTIPHAAIPRAPKWLPSLPFTRRKRLFGRLLIPLYDHLGIQRSVSGRIVDPATNEAGVSSLKAKASRPIRLSDDHPGFRADSLIMANTVAHQLLTRTPDDQPPTTDIVICEGEPDFLTRCQTASHMAVFGIYSGAWKPIIADRIPDGSRVFIEVDRDQQGDKYAEKIAQSLGSRCLLFKIRPDFGCESGGSNPPDINDMHQRGMLKAPDELCAPYTAHESRSPANAGEPPRDGDGPVRLDGKAQLRDLLADVWAHLTARNATIIDSGEVRPNEEPLFITPGDSALARIAWAPIADGSTQLTVERLSLAHVLHLLTLQFHWYAKDGEGNEYNKDPKSSVVTLVHGAARNAPQPPPVIHAITRTPVYGRDGSPIHKRGFHASDHLWYEPDECLASLPSIPDHPSDAARAKARELLSEAIGDFPFTGQEERATIYAAILLPFVRRMIKGPTPIHLIEAPVQGSGKTLLASIVSIISTGEDISPIVLNHNEEETQKALATELSRGRAVIVIDNLDTSHGPLNSPAFAMVATQTAPCFRRLGSNGPDAAMVLPNNATWIVTGNNVQVSQDLIRRFIRARLDPGMETPHMRAQSAFKHPDIVAWVRENRMQLVWAALTLCQSWISAGRKPGPQNLGSYESWAATIGGILDHAGIKGFLGNAQDFYGFANGEADSWGPFLDLWWRKFGGQQMPAKILNTMCEPAQYMAATRGDKGELSQTKRLAQALKNAHGRVMHGFKLCATQNSHTKNLEYSLEPVGEAPQTDAVKAPTTPTQADMFQGYDHQQGGELA